MSTPPDRAIPEDWQKLDPKTLLISPIKTLRQIVVPAAAALIGIGTQQPRWLLLATPAIIVVLLVASALPWLTTRYHVLGGQLVVKRGLLNKRRLTAPLDRVRTVDLEATLMHRLLGLQRVQVGTGVDDSRIELDALAAGQAGELRHFLLARSEVAAPPTPTPPAPAHGETGSGLAGSGLSEEPRLSTAPGANRTHQLARIDYGWVRYAPLSLARLAIVAVTIGAVSQFADDIPIFNADTGNTILDWIDEHSLWLLVPLVLVGFLVAWVIIAIIGYAAQWWDMRLVVEDENLHLTRGLFTTNSTTMEVARIRGINLNEPILMRWAGGADLSVLATGTSDGTPAVLPPCPADVATRVGGDILGSTAPLAVPLHPHGPAARRRCHVRHQWSTILVAVVIVPLLIALSGPWWVAAVVLLALAALGAGAAELAYRHLGHALTSEHLVAGSGSLSRTREILERDGVIGWVVSQSWFQRRRGLATLIATTAAGAEKVTVLDVPLDVAVDFADRATPGMLTGFLA